MDDKKILILGLEVWLCVEKVLGTPQCSSGDSPLFW